MICTDVELSLLDESAPRPAGLEAHLASCAHCQGFRRAHGAALGLRGTTPRRASVFPLAAVQRRAGVVLGLTLMLGGAVGLARLGASPVPVPLETLVAQPSSREGALVAPSSEDRRRAQAEWVALVALHEVVAASTRADPTREDLAYRSFGSLPSWLAPQTTQPQRALGRALSPVVLTTEN